MSRNLWCFGTRAERTPGTAAFGQQSIHWSWFSLLCVIFAPTLLWLWQRWTLSIWHNGHGLLVPFVVAFLVRDVLRRDMVQGEEASGWGFVFFIPALLLVVVDSPIKTQLLSAFALVLCLPGLSLLLLGARRTRALVFPWTLALFMLPIPAAFINSTQTALRRISAAGSEQILTLIGVPVLREETTLYLPNGSILIADACSGFSTLYAAATLSLLLAYMTPSLTRRAVLLLAAFPCALSCNIVRCSLLALAVNRGRGDLLDTSFHPLSGLLSFSAALALLFVLAGYGTRRRVVG